MSRYIAILLVALVAAGHADAYTLRSDEGRFTIEMPDKPEFRLHRIQRVRDGAIFESSEWRLDQTPMLTWMASYRDYRVDISADKLFNQLIRELPASLDGDLRLFQFIERGGTEGLEIRIFVPRNRLLLRSQIFIVGKRQYNISYVGPDGTENDHEVETYLNSFQILP